MQSANITVNNTTSVLSAQNDSPPKLPHPTDRGLERWQQTT